MKRNISDSFNENLDIPIYSPEPPTSQVLSVNRPRLSMFPGRLTLLDNRRQPSDKNNDKNSKQVADQPPTPEVGTTQIGNDGNN